MKTHTPLSSAHQPRRRARLAMTCLFLLLMALAAQAKLTTEQQAIGVVTGWLRTNQTPMGAQLGTTVKLAQPILGASGLPDYYVVILSPNGYVIVPGDDGVEPIVAFADSGAFDPSSQNPLGALVSADMAQRVAAARITPEPDAAARWSCLLRQQFTEAYLATVSDVRVAPFVQSRWNQTTVSSTACFNYYTPPGTAGTATNYPTGCVATAMAQVMRFYQYPTVGVGTGSYTISINGTTTTRTLRGGDGLGGAYQWANMPFVPGSTTTTTQRRAIGALCYDAGISVNMDYASAGSGADTLLAASALRNTFKYANAVGGNNGGNNIGAGLVGMLNPNLDARRPVILGITGTPGGHAVVADGYGYEGTVLYHHLNMGWSGTDDVWYELPTIDTHDANLGTFNTIYKVVYNISPASTGEIVSGRVLDANGLPMAGIAVDAVQVGNPARTYTATTDANGIYALTGVTSGTQVQVTVTATDMTFGAPRTVTVGTSWDNTATAGNVWGVDFVGEPNTRVLTLTAPNGGEGIEAGCHYTVTWSTQGAAWLSGDTVSLQYSADQGQSWQSIAGAVALPYTQGSFDWDTTGLQPGAQYLVRVVAATGEGDTSDGAFAITGPLHHFAITMASPQQSGQPVSGVCRVMAQDAAGNTITTFGTYNTSGRFPVMLSANGASISGLGGDGAALAASSFVNGVADLTAMSMVITVPSPPTTVQIHAANTLATGDSAAVLVQQAVDYFTEQFTVSPFDLNGKSLVFTPSSAPGGYVAFLRTITQFPTDPTGGQTLTLSDDSSIQLTLGGGKQVPFFGTPYGVFYVGSNGYLTFGKADFDYSESLEDHFAYPRISAFFHDLAPQTTGALVSVKQLADRVALTYQNVAVVGENTTDSFQIELYYNGRIVLSYLNMGSAYGLVGLSRGTGLPTDYVASNLSAYRELTELPGVSLGVWQQPYVSSTASCQVTYYGAETITLSPADVLVEKTGTVAYQGVSITGTGTLARTITLTGLTGDGTLRVSLKANTAQDSLGHQAPATAAGAWVTVDNTAPTLTVSAPSPAASGKGPVSYTLTYGDASTITLAANAVTLLKTGTANGAVSISGSGNTRTVTVDQLTGDGTLAIAIAAGTATDAAGNAAPAAGPSASCTVDNTAPVTGTDAYDLLQDANLTVTAPGVLANDTDASGSLTVMVGATTQHGTLTLHADGSFSYTPAAGYYGPDSFTYQAQDSLGNASAPTTVALTVQCTNLPPVAIGATYTVKAGMAFTGSVAGTDPEGASLTYAVTQGPTQGTLSLNTQTGAFTYESQAGASGDDAFWFTVSDGQFTSAPVEVRFSFFAVRVSPAVASPRIYQAGMTIPLTASLAPGNDGTGVQYAFVVGQQNLDTGGYAWGTPTAFEPNNVYPWQPAHAGTHWIAVYARSADGTAIVSNGCAFTMITEALTGVTLANVTPSPQPYRAGLNVTCRATVAEGDSSTGVTYAYLIGEHNAATGEYIWGTRTAFSASDTYTWQPPHAGTYWVVVYARSADGSYAVAGGCGFVVSSSTLTGVTLDSDTTSPLLYQAGQNVTCTAAVAAGDTAAGVTYAFVLGEYDPARAQYTWAPWPGFSATNTYTWQPAQAGTYWLGVYAQSADGLYTVSSGRGFTVLADTLTGVTLNSATERQAYQPGMSIPFTAGAIGKSAAGVTYAFLVGEYNATTGTYAWTPWTAFSQESTYALQPTHAGYYWVGVCARSADGRYTVTGGNGLTVTP